MIWGLGMVFEAMWMELGRSGGHERSKTAQGHPRALEETPRDDQKASPRASGSALEAPRWFLTPSERTWRAREAKMGALEGLGGQILDTFVKSGGARS